LPSKDVTRRKKRSLEGKLQNTVIRKGSLKRKKPTLFKGGKVSRNKRYTSLNILVGKGDVKRNRV